MHVRGRREKGKSAPSLRRGFARHRPLCDVVRCPVEAPEEEKEKEEKCERRRDFSSNGCAGGGTELGAVDFIKMSKKGRLTCQVNRFFRAKFGRLLEQETKGNILARL